MERETKYFYGNEVSNYGVENGRVDYRCLAKSFDGVLNNEIYSKADDWELENGDFCYAEDSEGNIYSESDAYDRVRELEDELDDLEYELAGLEDMWSFENLTILEEDVSIVAILNREKEIKERIEEIREDIDSLEDTHYNDVFQWYIIDENGASILERETDEIVMYSSELDMYIWGVCHYGTSWDYVLTSIAC